jgi:hypothetical protein
MAIKDKATYTVELDKHMMAFLTVNRSRGII